MLRIFQRIARIGAKGSGAGKEFVMRPALMRTTLIYTTLAVVFILSIPAAQTATPAAWQSLDAAARTGCGREIVRLASKAKIGDVTGRVSGIGAANDSDRYYALVLDAKTAGFKSQWLCLYDKRTKQVTAREIEVH